MQKYLILLLLSALQTVLIDAQTFLYKGKNLFGLQPLDKRFTNLMFYDIDSDGDQDFILSGIDQIKFDSTGNITSFSQVTYFISVQENIGTTRNPVFSPRKPFMDSFPFQKGYFFPAAGDLNDDHKLDFIVAAGLDSSYNLMPLYYQRKETGGSDQFNIIPGESLGLDPFISGSFFVPALADMDKDRDLDIFMSGYFLTRTESGDKVQKPVILYGKNIGDKSNPNFLSWYQNPYNLEKYIGENQVLAIGDIDNDADNDIVSLTNLNNSWMLKLLKNTPLANGKADFISSEDFPGIPASTTSELYFPPYLVDIDADGDLDLFMVQELENDGPGIRFYENDLCVASITQLTQTLCEGDSIVIGNQLFDQTGQYEVVLKSGNHCDSIVKLNLTVIPVVTTTNLVKSLCSGDEFIIGNEKFTITGQYEIKLKSGNGCDSIVKLDLTVHPNDSTNFVKTLCTGDEFVIGNEKFTQTGQYSVKLISSKGCDSIVQANLSFVTLNNTVSSNMNTLTANLTGVLYQWFDCENGVDIPGATAQSFTPSKSGKYGVKLTDANGCRNTSACIEIMITSNDEQVLSKQIHLYPNPASDFLTILNQTGYKPTSIKIINLDGKLIKTIPNDQMERISTADLNPGNYMLEIVCLGYKIIKQFDVIK